MQHSLPRFQVSTSSGAKKKLKKSLLRTILEFFVFVLWLIATGFGGYYVGYDPNANPCPTEPIILQQPVQPAVIASPQASSPNCGTAAGHSSSSDPSSIPPPFKPGGYTLQELQSLWECSHAVGNMSELNEQLLPKDLHIEKTKWKSIITVEPRAFFDKYLTQYPGDTRAVQPVIVFSHKPLKGFDELGEICKVLDIAVVPDKPGVCVAVTETYHDVASYHMLHADRQKDGSFALTSNFVDGRVLPEERAYAAARALLLSFFQYGEIVMTAMKEVPRYSKGKVVVGVLVEDAIEVELFLNSLASATKQGVNKSKFCVFTTAQSVYNDLHKSGIKVIYIKELATVGTEGDANVGPKLRRHFIQAWLAFAVANSLIKMAWQTPATIWFERPDNIMKPFPAVETLWVFKGRKDPRSAPFFISFDFFISEGVERPVHLLHELIMHFDLIMAWDSLDAVAAYRLTENNSRYGTTTFVLPPHQILHTDMMENDAEKLRQAVASPHRPMVIVIPKDYQDALRPQQLLRDAGLWFL